MYIYIYGSDQVSAMHPPPLTPPNYSGGKKERKKKKRRKEEKNHGKEICNLFRACLYFEEDILNQNR